MPGMQGTSHVVVAVAHVPTTQGRISTPAVKSIPDNVRNDQTCTDHHHSTLLQWIAAGSSILVWPCMLAVPLLCTITTSPFHYTKVFRPEWYQHPTVDSLDTSGSLYPPPLGLILGIVAVAVGQVWVGIFFFFYKYGYFTNGNEPISIQRKGSPVYEFIEGVRTHISQPEGFAALAGYLTITWMFRLMPRSYYNFDAGGIQYKETILCLILQDGLQYVMHRLEHDVSPIFYQTSHKPHHRFLNPRLFDAFNGSLTDTICMIIVPLFITANLVRTANVWTYMAFGSTYACWLTLIHSEYRFPWDPYFRCWGLGTPADHHVHHAFFKYNYGHLFMWFDQLAGTYHDPNIYTTKSFHDGV
jgi:alternative squalene epoxidase